MRGGSSEPRKRFCGWARFEFGVGDVERHGVVFPSFTDTSMQYLRSDQYKATEVDK